MSDDTVARFAFNGQEDALPGRSSRTYRQHPEHPGASQHHIHLELLGEEYSPDVLWLFLLHEEMIPSRFHKSKFGGR